jgi:hypothetical protein
VKANATTLTVTPKNSIDAPVFEKTRADQNVARTWAGWK